MIARSSYNVNLVSCGGRRRRYAATLIFGWRRRFLRRNQASPPSSSSSPSPSPSSPSTSSSSSSSTTSIWNKLIGLKLVNPFSQFVHFDLRPPLYRTYLSKIVIYRPAYAYYLFIASPLPLQRGLDSLEILPERCNLYKSTHYLPTEIRWSLVSLDHFMSFTIFIFLKDTISLLVIST